MEVGDTQRSIAIVFGPTSAIVSFNIFSSYEETS